MLSGHFRGMTICETGLVFALFFSGTAIGQSLAPDDQPDAFSRFFGCD